ncbi:P-selectin glycoprotein ligand 1 [Paroedura picta]|uniref:P-selectin glycoprotein ligand 1 n=1 Tax=Paroedura picta TaxID=143630 RepID=UPI004057C9F2
MGSFHRPLLVVLSSLLFAGTSAFPSPRLLFQDGGAGGRREARGLRAESALVDTGRWEWETAGEAGHEALPFPRRKRETVFPAATSLKTTTFFEEETRPSFVGPTTGPQLWEDETTEPGLAGNRFSSGATTTASPLQDPSTPAAVGHLSTARHKALLQSQTTTESLSEDFTETQGPQEGSRPSHGRDPTRPTSTAPSVALVATSAISGATKSGGRAGESARSSLSPSLASSRPASTVPARPPSRKAPPGPDQVVGQCLLAISLLALVAGVFILTTFLLIGLLLRQKRAYKLRRHNRTEMVCISSLLAAEEAEAAGEKAPRAKRVKRLAENGSETDMDNLTLNSFLPDH